MEFKPVKHADAWVEKRWRPLMGFTYIFICLFDFIIAPTLNYVFFFKTGADFLAWKPLTMSDGGLFHISMGAILGIAAYTRGQEKVNRYNYTPPIEDYSYGQEDKASYRDRISRNTNGKD